MPNTFYRFSSFDKLLILAAGEFYGNSFWDLNIRNYLKICFFTETILEKPC